MLWYSGKGGVVYPNTFQIFPQNAALIMIRIFRLHRRFMLWFWRIHMKENIMGFFKKKEIMQTYDKENKKPVIKSSICKGEQVAGFKDIHTGKMEEVMLIKNKTDLEKFKGMYGIDEEITKEY